MKKKKAHLGSWIGSGVCLVLALSLAGITIPKQGKIEELQTELDRLTPIADSMRRQDNAQKKPEDSAKDAELKAALPEEEEFLEFHAMVQKCAVDSGIGHIRYYSMEMPDYWPASAGSKIPPEGEIPIPTQYSEVSGQKSEIRRYPLQLDFETSYAALLRFANRLQQLPRFCQIVSMEIAAEGAKVRVLLRVEAYGLKVTR